MDCLTKSGGTLTFGVPTGASEPTVAPAARLAWTRLLADYWTLTKPEVNFLVLITCLVGFDLASSGPLDWPRLLSTLLGTLLMASGTGTLNQFIERRSDAEMRRTASRPLPSGRVRANSALIFGLLLAVLGGGLLWWQANLLSSGLALLTLASYLLLYTPLKKRTALCTLVGAFPGAMPPLIGWAAARGSLSGEAWLLYAILFVWQFPHFLAIAWMYREDYSRAGLRMLPAGDADGRWTGREIMAFLLALLPLSLVPAILGQAGWIYLAGATLLGFYFLYAGARLAAAPIQRGRLLARRLLFASIVYLPVVFCLMMVDKTRL
jgi:heme o synthase